MDLHLCTSELSSASVRFYINVKLCSYRCRTPGEQQKSNWLSFGVSSAMIGGYFGRGGSRLYISSIPCSGWSLWGCPHLRQQPLLEQSLLQCKIHCEETGQENRTNTNMCMRQGGSWDTTHNPQPPTLPSMPWEGVQAEARTT